MSFSESPEHKRTVNSLLCVPGMQSRQFWRRLKEAIADLSAANGYTEEMDWITDRGQTGGRPDAFRFVFDPTEAWGWTLHVEVHEVTATHFQTDKWADLAWATDSSFSIQSWFYEHITANPRRPYGVRCWWEQELCEGDLKMSNPMVKQCRPDIQTTLSETRARFWS